MNIFIQAITAAALAAGVTVAVTTQDKDTKQSLVPVPHSELASVLYDYKVVASVTHDNGKVTKHNWSLRGQVRVFTGKKECEDALNSKELRDSVEELKGALAVSGAGPGVIESVRVDCVVHGDPA